MADILTVGALVVGIVAVVMLAAASVLGFRSGVTARLSAIERRLAAVTEHLGIQEQDDPEIVDHVLNGRTVEAIKLYRHRNGADLVEAKRAVDDIARRGSGPGSRRAESP
jgi:ribosomal protein L7/L12